MLMLFLQHSYTCGMEQTTRSLYGFSRMTLELLKKPFVFPICIGLGLGASSWGTRPLYNPQPDRFNHMINEKYTQKIVQNFGPFSALFVGPANRYIGQGIRYSLRTLSTARTWLIIFALSDMYHALAHTTYWSLGKTFHWYDPQALVSFIKTSKTLGYSSLWWGTMLATLIMGDKIRKIATNKNQDTTNKSARIEG
ncbi:MAG: hypothetical protein UU47_C0003G0038 [candidate division TM6 bacterium GW2011_GWE2_41_16]|nr:MAG: hypothetical protein UU47_C0003G0038 [candidate division TM6 bacterium GW2011_GWE2_41_16]